MVSAPLASLAFCLLLLLPLAAPAAAAPIPAMPKWAKGPTFKGKAAWPSYSIGQGEKNRDAMKAANASKKPYDFLLFGDSITQLIYRNGKAQMAAAFPPAAGWRAAAYGISGNDVQDLAWRLMAPSGWERPKLAPRVVALLIGTNNVNAKMKIPELESKLDYVLSWWAAAYPKTKVILMALLPSIDYSVAAANVRYRALAAKRRVTYKDCGGVIDAQDPAILYDGTHPTPSAMELLLRCLAPTVGALAGKPVYTNVTNIG